MVIANSTTASEHPHVDHVLLKRCKNIGIMESSKLFSLLDCSTMLVSTRHLPVVEANKGCVRVYYKQLWFHRVLGYVHSATVMCMLHKGIRVCRYNLKKVRGRPMSTTKKERYGVRLACVNCLQTFLFWAARYSRVHVTAWDQECLSFQTKTFLMLTGVYKKAIHLSPCTFPYTFQCTIHFHATHFSITNSPSIYIYPPCTPYTEQQMQDLIFHVLWCKVNVIHKLDCLSYYAFLWTVSHASKNCNY